MTPPHGEDRPARGDGLLIDRQPEPRPDPLAPTEEKHHHGPLGFLRELPGLIFVAFLLALLIKSFLVQAFFIPSQSMENTLLVGDRVLVNKMVYRFREPRRGEVMVFINPNAPTPDRNFFEDVVHWVTEGLGFSSDPQKDFIKRVIGLPGDVIELRRGKVFVNGKRLQEPYLHPERGTADEGPYTVGEDQFFMMGDNRTNSSDSRVFGAIPRENIVGRAFVILWPPSRFEWLGSG
jgi:signal peptidase I